jgi:L-ascorbate metabolism protein UlaG (beta-lactamase superfamily)
MAAQFIAPKAVLPIHFGTFPPLTGTPEELDSWLKGSIEVLRVAPGESI